MMQPTPSDEEQHGSIIPTVQALLCLLLKSVCFAVLCCSRVSSGSLLSHIPEHSPMTRPNKNSIVPVLGLILSSLIIL